VLGREEDLLRPPAVFGRPSVREYVGVRADTIPRISTRQSSKTRTSWPARERIADHPNILNEFADAPNLHGKQRKPSPNVTRLVEAKGIATRRLWLDPLAPKTSVRGVAYGILADLKEAEIAGLFERSPRQPIDKRARRSFDVYSGVVPFRYQISASPH
jgi:hypothetical protein